jgi:hypothetical protein
VGKAESSQVSIGALPFGQEAAMTTSPANPADVQDRSKKGSGSDRPGPTPHQDGGKTDRPRQDEKSRSPAEAGNK